VATEVEDIVRVAQRSAMRTAFRTREPRYATTGMKSQIHTNATAALVVAARRGGHLDASAGCVSVVINTMAETTAPMIANRFVNLRAP
jgi:hypothetical protein